MQKKYDVAVVFGGVSNENEVSVITGTMACNVLIKGGKSVLPVYVDHEGVMRAGEQLADVTIYKQQSYLKFPQAGIMDGGFVLCDKKGKPKVKIEVGCVLNCCHGGAGEGGAVAGVCAFFGLACASAGLFESAAFMDKYYTKLVLQSLGVNLAKYAYSRDITGAIEGAKKIGYPVIVKPAKLGSSIGIAKAADEKELEEALNVAFELDDGVLIEQFLSPRREINCAAYLSEGKITVSELEEVASAGAILSYDDKYTGGGERIFPASLDAGTENHIKSEVERVYSALNMRGVVRFDYIICGNQCYLSEVNTVPGSLSQYLLSDSYKSFYKVLCGVIEQALSDFKERGKKRVIKTGILNNIVSNGCKVKR